MMRPAAGEIAAGACQRGVEFAALANCGTMGRSRLVSEAEWIPPASKANKRRQLRLPSGRPSARMDVERASGGGVRERSGRGRKRSRWSAWAGLASSLRQSPLPLRIWQLRS